MDASSHLIERAADALWRAAAGRTTTAPVNELLGMATDYELGYRVQHINFERSLAAGRRPTGRKVVLTSRLTQTKARVTEPAYGALFADAEFANGSDIPASKTIQAHAEAEVAFVLSQDLDRPPHRAVDVIASIAYALPTIEMADSRITGWKITPVDTIADGACAGVYVLGTRPVPVRRLDLRVLPMSTIINGRPASSGSGRTCLGNPLIALKWLADDACRRGVPLRAGEVIATGSLGPSPSPSVGPGDIVEARLGDLGTVWARLDHE